MNNNNDDNNNNNINNNNIKFGTISISLLRRYTKNRITASNQCFSF